jgi:hypothetical protein
VWGKTGEVDGCGGAHLYSQHSGESQVPGQPGLHGKIVSNKTTPPPPRKKTGVVGKL